MESLLLQSNSKKDIAMLEVLAKKIGLRTRHLSEEELDDIGLANAMRKGRTGEFVDSANFFTKIKTK